MKQIINGCNSASIHVVSTFMLSVLKIFYESSILDILSLLDIDRNFYITLMREAVKTTFVSLNCVLGQQVIGSVFLGPHANHFVYQYVSYPRHTLRCSLLNRLTIFPCNSARENPRVGSGPHGVFLKPSLVSPPSKYPLFPNGIIVNVNWFPNFLRRPDGTLHGTSARRAT